MLSGWYNRNCTTDRNGFQTFSLLCYGARPLFKQNTIISPKLKPDKKKSDNVEMRDPKILLRVATLQSLEIILVL